MDETGKIKQKRISALKKYRNDICSGPASYLGYICIPFRIAYAAILDVRYETVPEGNVPTQPPFLRWRIVSFIAATF